MKLLKIAIAGSLVFAIADWTLTNTIAKTAAKDGEGSTQLPKMLPSKLPKKALKKAKLNFEVNSGTHTTTVVVRTPLPLDQALDDQARAQHAVQDLRDRDGVKVNSKAVVIPPYGAPVGSLIAEQQAISSAQDIQLPPKKPARIDFHLIKPQESPSPKLILIEEARIAPPSQQQQQPQPQAQPQTELPPPPAAKAAAPEPNQVPAAAQVPAQNPISTESIPVKVEVETAVTVIAAPVPAATLQLQDDKSHGERFLARASYLDAHYNELEGDLQKGANSFGLGFARRFAGGEGRLQIEAGFGMDQEIAAQNIRYLIARSDFIYFFANGTFRPFAGAGLGFGSFNVRSQRANYRGSADLIYRQHASGSALIASPLAGLRLDFGSFAFDLSAEYLIVAGAGSSTSLGGGVGALTLVLPF